MDVDVPSGVTFPSSASCSPSSGVASLAVVKTTAVKSSAAPPIVVDEALLLFRRHSGSAHCAAWIFFHPRQVGIVAAAILALETAFGPPPV